MARGPAMNVLLRTPAPCWPWPVVNCLRAPLARCGRRRRRMCRSSARGKWQSRSPEGSSGSRSRLPGDQVGCSSATNCATFPLMPAWRARRPPCRPLHRDPFDRVLVALAQTRGFTVLTLDQNIGKYPEVTTLSVSAANVRGAARRPTARCWCLELASLASGQHYGACATRCSSSSSSCDRRADAPA